MFTDSSGGVYLGQAAHCSSTGGDTETNGCSTKSLPLGTPIYAGDLVNGGVQTGTKIGTLAYNSWIAMQQKGEQDASTCEFNDLALIKIATSQVGNVNPTIPFWGGPNGLAPALATTGSQIYSYGNSILRLGVSALSPKTGVSLGEAEGSNGWSEQLYTVTPGIPGDSGSAFLNSSGDALGVLSTVEFAPVPASNGVGTLAKELAYANAATGLGLTVATGTAPFKAGFRRGERLAPALGEGELADRVACELLRPGIGGPAHADVRGERDVVGNREQPLHLGLGRHEQRGHRRGELLAAQREQQVLHERVDRGAADDALPRQRGVGDREVVEAHPHDEVQRHLVEALRVFVRALHHAHARRVERPRVGEHQRRAGQLRVGAPRRQVEVAQRPRRRGVLDGDHPPALAVAAARSEARAVERPHERLARHGLRGEVAARGGAAHRLEQVHRAHATGYRRTRCASAPARARPRRSRWARRRA